MVKVQLDGSNIDWELLRQQKLKLVEMLMGGRVSLRRTDALEGVVSLLDDLQDQAAEQLGEAAVFGYRKGKET